MKKILIATHGNLAEGFLSCIELLTGSSQEIQTINAYVDGGDFNNELAKFINNIDGKDQVIVFTDLFSGSVNQRIMNIFLEKEIYAIIISGFNLPILLEICLSTENLTKECLYELIQKSREELKINNLMELDFPKDETFF